MIDVAPVGLGFAFSLGVATFFAPCAFPLLPGYVAFYLGRDDGPSRSRRGRLLRGAGIGLTTSVGFFVVYAVLAGIALAVGTSALRDVSSLELVVGVLLVALGAGMASGRIEPGTFHVPLPERRQGPVGYLAFGIVYAAAAAGCTAPLFVAAAGVALTAGPVGAVLTLGAYAAGMSVLMVGVTLGSALGKDALLHRLSANAGKVRRVAGVALVIAGLVQLYYYLYVFGGLQSLGLA